MAAFRTPYHPSPSSTSIGDVDRDRGGSNFSTASLPFQQQFTSSPTQFQVHSPQFHSPQSPFHTVGEAPSSPYSARPPYGMKQSMSDFSTIHGHDTESATIHPATRAHDEPDPEMNTPGKPSLLMRLRRLIPNSFYCRLYLLAVLVEAAIDVVIEGVIYLKMRDYLEGQSATDQTAEDDLTVKRLPVYLAIFAFAHVYQFILAMFAVHQRNTMQFIFLGLFNLLLLIYSIIQISEIRVKSNVVIKESSRQAVNVLTATIPCIISIAQIIYAGLAWKIYQEFGWKVYKLLGADRLVKKMYAHYLFYECLIKFDGFFWVGFSVQYLALVLRPNEAEYYLTLAMTPGCFLVLLVGHLAARHENKWMMISFFLGCLCALVYFSYKLFRIWSLRKQADYIGVWKSHSIFAAISVVFLVITFASGLLVWNNFGKGLKKQMDKADLAKKQAESMEASGHKRTGTVVSSYMMNGTGGPKRNNRMSIE